VSEDPDCFTEELMLLLQSYCNLAAAAIQNAYLFDQVRLGNDQLHALSHRLMDVQEAERVALSRELHDESSQVLAALSVNLGLLERDAESSELVRAHAADLKQIATELLSNLHAQALKLRPASLDHLGLVAALQQYIREFNRQYHLDVQFETVGIEGVQLPGDLETALFRIVQESLTNVALHAQASRVDVLLNRRNGSLVMTVEDNGIGFNPDEPAHPDRLGLFGMRERIEMLGGRLVVESAPGKGTMISAEVPCGDSRPDRG
jgi:signal transduction histidine kinase